MQLLSTGCVKPQKVRVIYATQDRKTETNSCGLQADTVFSSLTLNDPYPADEDKTITRDVRHKKNRNL